MKAERVPSHRCGTGRRPMRTLKGRERHWPEAQERGPRGSWRMTPEGPQVHMPQQLSPSPWPASGGQLSPTTHLPSEDHDGGDSLGTPVSCVTKRQCGSVPTRRVCTGRRLRGERSHRLHMAVGWPHPFSHWRWHSNKWNQFHHSNSMWSETGFWFCAFCFFSGAMKIHSLNTYLLNIYYETVTEEEKGHSAFRILCQINLLGIHSKGEHETWKAFSWKRNDLMLILDR